MIPSCRRPSQIGRVCPIEGLYAKAAELHSDLPRHSVQSHGAVRRRGLARVEQRGLKILIAFPAAGRNGTIFLVEFDEVRAQGAV